MIYSVGALHVVDSCTGDDFLPVRPVYNSSTLFWQDGSSSLILINNHSSGLITIVFLHVVVKVF